jgi:hypothetical protein
MHTATRFVPKESSSGYSLNHIVDYIKYSAHFGIPKSLLFVHCTWCIHDTVQRIAWWWLLWVETCRYMHNLTIINRCVWLKLYILSSFVYVPVNFIHQPSVLFTSTVLTFQKFLTFFAWGKYTKLFSWYIDVCYSLFYKKWTPSCCPLSLPYIMQTNQINPKLFHWHQDCSVLERDAM